MPYWEEKNLYTMFVRGSVETRMTCSINNGKPAAFNALRLIMMVMIIQFNSSIVNVLV